MGKTHTVSKDPKSGLWYCHMIGFPYIPVFGSFCEKKSEAMEYVKMYHGLPNRANEIEERRKLENGSENQDRLC